MANELRKKLWPDEEEWLRGGIEGFKDRAIEGLKTAIAESCKRCKEPKESWR